MFYEEYQPEAVSGILGELEREGKTLVSMAMGLGKTRVAIRSIQGHIKEGKGLFLCHDNSILEQAMKEFAKIMGKGISMGIFNGEKKQIGNDITFASFQTMFRWKSTFPSDEFPIIIVDEAHHIHARTFKEVIDYFRPKFLIGLTGSPDRMDGKDIGEIFGKKAVDISVPEAIGKGWLAEVEYRLVTDNISRQKLKKIVAGALKEGKKVSLKQLNEEIFIEARDEKVAETILSYGGKKTIVFCENIPHAEHFQKFIPGSEIYHSGLSPKKNRETLNSFRIGGCQRVLTVDKMNEGVDIPDAEMIVFLRCTDSKRIFLQQLGRGLRKTESKSKVIVLDFAGNVERVRTISEISEKVWSYVPKDSKFGNNPLYVKGFFHFVFTDEQIDLLRALKRLDMKYVSDVPELLEEYSDKNPEPASMVSAGSDRKLWWKCSNPLCGYEWQKSAYRRKKGSKCPACSNKVITEKNNLAVTHPLLAAEYSDENALPANKVAAVSIKKFFWKCAKPSCGYEWRARGYDRALGSGCPACSHRNSVITSKNNMAVLHPELAKEYSPKNVLPAGMVFPGTIRKFWWKCPFGHEWEARASDRVGGHGCPECWSARNSELSREREKKKVLFEKAV